MAEVIGAHLASLNLFREPDGTVEITVADATETLFAEYRKTDCEGPPINYVEKLIVEAAERIKARREQR